MIEVILREMLDEAVTSAMLAKVSSAFSWHRLLYNLRKGGYGALFMLESYVCT